MAAAATRGGATPIRVLVAGQTLRASKHDEGGEVSVTPEQIAHFLGFKNSRSVMKLYRAHAAELRPLVRTAPVLMRGARRVTCFLPRALVHFACLARTKKAAEFRAALADHIEAAGARRGKVGGADLMAEAQDVLCEAFARIEPLRDAAPKNSEPADVLSDALRAIDEHLAVIDVQVKGAKEAAMEIQKVGPRRDGWALLGGALGKK